ncbi:ABC transporter permease [Neiella marina]|uniref:ABC transporter permease n=1 Tax=Neiella marina TaxID=508461 RepID=A0A8J2U7G1_9GAMM|nr:ABC transporter permease [Neiella marina]GGA83994.1 ABC transporter permease [Neiella marina]
MFSNYLVTAWRNIVKNGVFSAINIIGLAVALMSCILIMLFVREESGYDQWLTDSDRLVRIHTAYTMPGQPPFYTVRSAGRMMEALRDFAANEVSTGVRLIQWGTTVQHQGTGYAEELYMVDPTFFDVFDLPFEHGDPATSFSKPMDLVISQQMALKFFGRTDVIGETITFCCHQSQPYVATITGVLKDSGKPSHLNPNFVFYLNPALFQNDTNVLHTWTSVNVYTYFKLNAGVSPEQFQQRIDFWLNNESPLIDMAKRFLGEAGNGLAVTDVLNLKVMPVADLHLKAKLDSGTMGDLTPMGDQQMINTFSLVAILVLVIACINFMNLATAKASKRAKEVAMRKVLGASRTQVAVQFLSEAIALVLIAMLVAIAAAELALPFYNDIIGKQLELALFRDLNLLLSLVAIAVMVGLLAGLYPAVYLSRFLPGHILKASKSSESAGSSKLRNSLVIGQFATSIVLVVATLVVYGQTLYSNHVDVGYQYHDKLVLNIRAANGNLDSLKHQLQALPEVSSVSFSSESPTQDNENNTMFTLVEANPSGEKVDGQILNYYHMDYQFFDSYGIQPLAGRVFSEEFGADALSQLAEGSHDLGHGSVILNVTAAKKFGFSAPAQAVGKTLHSDQRHLKVIGVIPDIHFRSVKFGIRASVYMVDPARYAVANIGFDTADVPALLTKIQTIWDANVTMQPMTLEFLSEMMAAQYQDEATTAELFLAFSVLAIIIACLGLYGLSAYTVERRTKEIGVRKVMGASVTDVIRLLIWQFSKPVMQANLIAWPIAIYLMLDWLSHFPYRIEQWYLLPICAAVGLLSLSIAWITVAGNAARVARRNPIRALRYE